MGIFTEVGNPSNRYEFPPLKIDEFIPFVALKPQRVKDAMKNTYEIDGDEVSDTEEKAALSEHLENEAERNGIVQQLITEKKKLTLTFTITKGFEGLSRWDDDDGYLEPKLAEEDEDIKIIYEESSVKRYGDTITIDVEINSEEAKEFYIDFYANDNEDRFQGNYKDVYCGRVKIVFEVLCENAFSEKEILPLKKFLIENATVNINTSNHLDCITTVNKGLRILLKERVSVGSAIHLTMDKLLKQNRIKPNSKRVFEFKDIHNKITKGIKEPHSIEASVSAEISNQISGCRGFHVFGLSVGDGYHSLMVTVDNRNKNTNVFYLSDQNPVSWGYTDGWRQMTDTDLDDWILKYTKNSIWDGYQKTRTTIWKVKK